MRMPCESFRRSSLVPRALLLFTLVFGCMFPLRAQEPPANAPSAPDSSKPAQENAPSPLKQTTEMFVGYATNRSFFFPDIATSPGPIPPIGKFKIFVNQSISPPYIFIAAISAAYNQARNAPPGYGQGWDSYASRFGSKIASSTSSSFFGTFLFPTLLHQDPRFFPQNKPSLWGSVKYSARRVVITRDDKGKDVFNSSEILGSLVSEGIANAYLPSSERTAGKTATRFAYDLAWKFGANMFKNYWPTFFHNMGLNRLRVIPNPGSPEDQQPK